MLNSQLSPFTIGGLTIDPPLVLAPMVGVSHSPFRQLTASLGKPGLFFTEMLSARRVPAENPATAPGMKRTVSERPAAFQIFAANPDDAAAACRKLIGSDAEIIDLNLACPAPEIMRKHRAGAHLLNDLRLTEKILVAMRAIVDRPLTAKIRLGKKPDLDFLGDIAAVLEGCGVDAVTLHPRLTGEKLKRKARWEYIGHLKTMTRLPVIGNGDVTTPEECFTMFSQTGCDGVMIGRAAIRKPWIFAEICGHQTKISAEFLFATYVKACDLITDFFPERQALGRIKEFTWHYSGNLRFGHRLAARMQTLDSVRECQEMAADNFLAAL